MKGIYWNSRGLSDLAKYRYISEAIREQNLNFVAVMETEKKGYVQSESEPPIWRCGLYLALSSTERAARWHFARY